MPRQALRRAIALLSPQMNFNGFADISQGMPPAGTSERKAKQCRRIDDMHAVIVC